MYWIKSSHKLSFSASTHQCPISTVFSIIATRQLIVFAFSDPDYWNNLAEEYINTRLNLKENKNIAKNVILFIGDGLGSTTITSSRILRGQINGMPGEETILKFEEFPHVALSKVRMLNYMYHYSECFIMPPSRRS